MTRDYPLQYNGEFVLTKNGSKDFGEISQEIARKIHRQAGKIRRLRDRKGRSPISQKAPRAQSVGLSILNIT